MPVNIYTDPFASASDIANRYDEDDDDSVFTGGVKAGLYGLGSSFNNALAAGGRVLGADTFAQGIEREADRLSREAAIAGHKTPHLEQVGGVGDAVDWGTGLVGQNLPLLGTMVGGGLLGGAAGAAFARKTLPQAIGEGVTRNTMAALAKKGMSAGEEAAVSATAALAGRKAAEEAAQRSTMENIFREGLGATSRPATIGSKAGVVLPYFGTTAGETYSGIRNDPSASGTPAEQARAALLSGAAQTALGTIIEPLDVMRRIGRKTISPLAAVGLTSLGEGVTEAGEQAIQQFTQNQFNPNAGYDAGQLLEAGLGGALVGGVYSAPAAAVQALAEVRKKKEAAPNMSYDDVSNVLNTLRVPQEGITPEYQYTRAKLLAQRATLATEVQPEKAAEGFRDVLVELQGMQNEQLQPSPELEQRVQSLAAAYSLYTNVLPPEITGAVIAEIEGVPQEIKALDSEALQAEHASVNAVYNGLKASGITVNPALEARMHHLNAELSIRTTPTVDDTAAAPITSIDTAATPTTSAQAPRSVQGSVEEQSAPLPPNTSVRMDPNVDVATTDTLVPNAPAVSEKTAAMTDEDLSTEANKASKMASDLAAQGHTVPTNLINKAEELAQESNRRARANTTEDDEGAPSYEDLEQYLRSSYEGEYDTSGIETEGEPDVGLDGPSIIGAPPVETTRSRKEVEAELQPVLEQRRAALLAGEAVDPQVETKFQELIAERDAAPLDVAPVIDDFAPFRNTPEISQDDLGNVVLTGDGAAAVVGDTLVGVTPNGTPFINMNFGQKLLESGELEEHLGNEYKDLLSSIGVEPKVLTDAILNTGENSAPVENLADFLGRLQEARKINDIGLSTSPPLEREIASVLKALTPNQRVALGLSTSEENGLLVDPVAAGISQDPEKRCSLSDDEGAYRVLADATNKDSLRIPSNTIIGLVKNLPVFLNGEAIPKRRVKDILIDSLATGKPVDPKYLMAAAKKDAEFRTIEKQRPVAIVDVDGYGEAMTIDVRVEDGVVQSRPSPLQTEYRITPAKIRTNREEGFQKGYEEIVAHMAKQGKVLVGTMDNNLYFASPEDADRLYKDWNISEDIKHDLALVERVGTILKKQSAHTSKIKLTNFAKHKNEPRFFHDDKTHDGLIIKAPGVKLSQGVALRKMVNPDTGETYYEVEKGMTRSLLRDEVGYTINDDGSLNMDGRDVVLAKGGQRVSEAPSLNKSLQLGKTRDPNTLDYNDSLTLHRLFPPPLQRGGVANLQQLLFSILHPVEMLRRDRLERFTNVDPADMLTGDNARKLEFGIPAGRLIKPHEVLNKLTEIKAHTARAYTLSSNNVPLGSVKLLPKTFNDINKAFREVNGRNIEMGDTIMLHRDPALSDGSSMGTYTFAGVMTLDAQDVMSGIVVNPKDEKWKEAAGDFDGDAAVATLIDEFMQHSETMNQDEGKINFVRKGAKIAPTIHRDVLENRTKALDPTLSDEERQALINQDQLGLEAGSKANGFSQMIGKIMSAAQQLKEMGLENTPITVRLLDSNGVPTGETVIVPMALLLAKIGQASISAKKKPVFSTAALEYFETISAFIRDNKIIERHPVTGALIKDGKKFVKEAPFVQEFRAIKRAALKKKTRFTTTKQDAMKAVVAHASRVMQRIMVFYLDIANSPANKVLYDDAMQAIKKELAVLKVSNLDNMKPREILTEWYNKSQEGLVGTPPEARTYVTHLLEKFPNFKQRTGNRTIYNTEAAHLPIYAELALRALAINDVSERIGVLNERNEFPGILKQAAILQLGDSPDPKMLGKVQAYRTKYDALSEKVSTIDPDEDLEAFEAASEELTELRREITIAYLVGQISSAALVAHGPQSMVASILPSKAFESMLNNLKLNVNQPINMPVVGYKGNEQLKPGDIPDGLYYYRENTGLFHRLQGINTDDGAFVPSNYTIKRAPAPTMASEDALSKVNLGSFIEPRLDGGLIWIRRPSGWTEKENATSLGMVFSKLDDQLNEAITRIEENPSAASSVFEEMAKRNEPAKKANATKPVGLVLKEYWKAEEIKQAKQGRLASITRPKNLKIARISRELQALQVGDQISIKNDKGDVYSFTVTSKEEFMDKRGEEYIPSYRLGLEPYRVALTQAAPTQAAPTGNVAQTNYDNAVVAYYNAGTGRSVTSINEVPDNWKASADRIVEYAKTHGGFVPPVVAAGRLGPQAKTLIDASRVANVQQTVSLPIDGSVEATVFIYKVFRILKELDVLEQTGRDVALPLEYGNEGGTDWITTVPALDFIRNNSDIFSVLGKKTLEIINNGEEVEAWGNGNSAEVYRDILKRLYPQTASYLKQRQAAAQAGQKDLFEGTEHKPRANTTDEPGSIFGGDLAKLSENLQQDKLQETADSFAALFGMKTGIKVITAQDMHDMLREAGQNELAELIIKHAEGKKGGARGMHYIDQNGQHFIYVDGSAGENSVERQVGILSHEVGHALIDDNWETLKKSNLKLAAEIGEDFYKYLLKDGVKGRTKAITALRKFVKENPELVENGLFLYDKRIVVNFAKNYPSEAGQLTDIFHEWMADNIGKYLLTEEKPTTAAGSWFKDLGSKFMAAFAQLKSIIRRVFMDGKEPATLASVKTWMDSLAKNEEELATMYGPGIPGQSLADRIEQRRARLANWAANPSAPNLEVLNELVPQIKKDLVDLIGIQDAELLRRVAFESSMQRRMWTLVGKNTQAAEAISENADTAAAYMYALVTNGILRVDPPTNGALAKLREALVFKTRLSLEASDEEINTMIARMSNPGVNIKSSPIIPPNSPAARLYNISANRYAQGVRGAAQRAAQGYRNVFSWYTDVPYDRILNTRIPALIEMAKIIQPMAWELSGMKRAGSQERANASYHIFARRAADIVTSLTVDERDKLADVLQGVTPHSRASQKVQDAADKVRGLLDGMHKYESKWIEMGMRKNYFPMILNDDFIREHMPYVVNLYMSDPRWTANWNGPLVDGDKGYGWRRVKEDYKEWIIKNGEAGWGSDPAVVLAFIDVMSVEQFIEFYLSRSDQQLLPGNQIKVLSGDRIHTPGFRFMNPRELDFLLHSGNPDVHKQIVDTLDNDVAHVLQRYIRSSVKRTQYARLMERIGGVQHLWERARQQGASESDIQLAVNYLDAINSMLGIKERDGIDNWIDGFGKDSYLQRFHSNKNRVMNEKLQKTQSWITMWQDISHLTLSVFSTFPDAMGQLVKHGDWSIFKQSINDSRALAKALATGGNLTAIQEFVLATGVLEHTMTKEDLAATYYGPGMARVPQKILNTMFKYNGVEYVTDKTRMMAGFAAARFMVDYKRRAEAGDMKALMELHRLGLAPEDIKLDANGDPVVLLWEEWEQASPEERERDLRVRAATHRFVDESTVRPDPTTRPLFVSNPYYQLVSLWAGFITAFDNQILRPAWARAAEDNNLVPLAVMVSTFVPIMLFADMLRDVVKTAFDDRKDKEGDKILRPAWKSGWTMQDHLQYAVERAGLYGRFEKVMDILEPVSKGNFTEAAANVGGVTTSDIRKVANWGPSQIPIPGKDLWGSWKDRDRSPPPLDRVGHLEQMAG